MAGKTTTEAANHLRAWREHAGLTQSQLAEKVDTKAGVISELESGKARLSDKWLRRIAPHVGTTAGRLLDYAPDEIENLLIDQARQVPPDRQAEALAMLKILSGRSPNGGTNGPPPTPQPLSRRSGGR